jgi:hypothetical protein
VEIQERLLRFVTLTNWILFSAASALGLILSPADFARGIIFGGLIVTINFHLLYRTLKKAFRPPHLASHQVVLAKYYLRFIVSAFIIFILISQHYVNPLGLIIGLSVVVVSIILATICEFVRLFSPSISGEKEGAGSLSSVIYYASIGFFFVLSIFAGLATGIYLDRYVFGTYPWLTLVFLALGVFLGFRNVGKAIKKFRRF